MRLFAAATVTGIAQLSAVYSVSVVTIALNDTGRTAADAPAASLSADGRYVAFSSYTPLVVADADASRDVYVFDRTTGRVTLESAPPGGRSSNLDNARPSISGSGRYVVFEMADEIVLRDRHEATTTIIATGRDPVISSDGRFVAFASSATNIVAGVDANRAGSDVYLADVANGILRRVSVGSDGLQLAIGSSMTPSVSADARYVAFVSSAPFGEHAAQGRSRSRRRLLRRIYVHDTHSGRTKHVGPPGISTNADGWGPVISASGRHVAFVSAATNLVADDDNDASDVFLADVELDILELVSRSTRGTSGNGISRAPTLSGDGRVVAFQSLASDLICSPCARAVEDINLLWDVFLLDVPSGAMTRVSTDAAGGWMEPSTGPSLNASGRLITYSSRHPIDAADHHNDFDLFVVERR